MPTSDSREANDGFAFRPRFDLGLSRLLPAWRALLSTQHLRADLVSGLTVAAVAIPLSLAIAVASEVPPAAGLISAIVGSIIVAFWNGTTLGVSGPAAAMAVLLGTVVEAHGMSGVLVVGLIAGVLQLATGALGLGRLARLVPSTVIHGFTAGIGAIIIIQQFPRALGFPAPDEAHIFSVFLNLGTYLSEARPAAVGIALLVIALAVLLPKVDRRIPSLLIAVIVPTIVVAVTDLDVLTIGQLPAGLPMPSMPSIEAGSVLPLLGAGAVVFLVASLETLLSSSAVDRMAGDRHDPDQELIGQGIGNIATAMMGGILVTGVIARSALNVQAGGRTRRAAIVSGVGVLVAVLFFAGVMAQIPMAALAGVLLVVGARMIHPSTFLTVWRFSRTEAAVMLVTFVTIVVVDLLAGIQAGVAAAVVVAAARLGRSRASLEASDAGPTWLSLRGPQTFLAGLHAEAVRDQLDAVCLERGLVVDLRDVRDIDSTGVDAMAAVVTTGMAAGGGVALLGARGAVRQALLASHNGSIFEPLLAASTVDADAIVSGSLRGRQQLVHGIARFRQEDRDRLAGIFEQIAQAQRPHTLFVTCGDSRISPGLLTGTDPGEIFVLRNVGGLVPVAGCAAMENERTGLRYAVDVLGVSDIVVCSHSNCGAVGLLRTPVGAEMDPFAGFRDVAATATGDVTLAPTTDQAAQRVAVRQVQNLLTHDFVRARVDEGALKLHAWFYDVGTPELYEWNPETDEFQPVA